MGRTAGVVTQRCIAEKLSGTLVDQAEKNSESDVVEKPSADKFSGAVSLAGGRLVRD